MNMKKSTKIIATLAIAASAVVGLAACTSDADKASENIAIEAEQFNVQRSIVAVNGITGQTLMYAEGRCSFEVSGRRFDLTCKVSDDQFRKNTIILGDQDSVYVATEKPIDVSVYHTKIVIKPQNVIPEFDIEMGED